MESNSISVAGDKSYASVGLWPSMNLRNGLCIVRSGENVLSADSSVTGGVYSLRKVLSLSVGGNEVVFYYYDFAMLAHLTSFTTAKETRFEVRGVRHVAFGGAASSSGFKH